MTGRETVHPNGPVDLGAVVAAFAEALARRSPTGSFLSRTDVQTAVETDGVRVRFQGVSGLRSGIITLSQPDGAVTATYTVGLWGGWAVLAGLAVTMGAVWGVAAVRGAPFPGGLAFGLLWVVGGNYLLARRGLSVRMLDLLVEAVRSASASPRADARP